MRKISDEAKAGQMGQLDPGLEMQSTAVSFLMS